MTPVVVVLKEYDVPKGKIIKVHVPKFWIEKSKGRKLELCENAVTGNLEIRKKKPAEINNDSPIQQSQEGAS